jgi:hypothetical protein
VRSFKTAKTAAGRIWEQIQSLGETPKPKSDKKAKGGAQAAKGAPAKTKATKKTTPAKKAPKAKDAAKTQDAAGPREGSKTEQVIAMLNARTVPRARGDHGEDGVAKTHRSRIHGRLRHRVLQA